MCRNCLQSLCVVVAFGLVAGARADDVKPIIEKAIAAHGGADAVTKYKAAQTKHKGKLTLPGVGDVEFTQELAVMMPDKFKESLEFEIMNQKIMVVTMAIGDKISVEANGKAIDVTDAIKEAVSNTPYAAISRRLAAKIRISRMNPKNDAAIVLTAFPGGTCTPIAARFLLKKRGRRVRWLEIARPENSGPSSPIRTCYTGLFY